MKITNKNNFGPIIQAWLMADFYDYIPGVYSATTLKNPPRMTILRERHDDELTVDLADLVAMRYGTAIHDSIDKALTAANLEGIEHEKRLFAEVLGQLISGKFDGLIHYEEKHLHLADTKTTSVWKYIYKEFVEFIKQLSVYRFLITKQPEYDGMEVDDTATIMFYFTDWSKKEAGKNPDYPQSRILEQEINLWSLCDTEEWIKERLLSIEEAKKLPDADLPFCSDEDIWKQPDKWALMKEGGSRAIKVYDNEAEANDALKPGYYIEHRPGIVRRCRNYCPCWSVCNQYQILAEQGLVVREEE